MTEDKMESSHVRAPWIEEWSEEPHFCISESMLLYMLEDIAKARITPTI